MSIVLSYGTLKTVTLTHGCISSPENFFYAGHIVDILGFVSCMISVKSTAATQTTCTLIDMIVFQ